MIDHVNQKYGVVIRTYQVRDNVSLEDLNFYTQEKIG